MFEQIQKKLLAFRRRWRLVNAVSYLSKGALAGVLFSVFLFLLGIFISLPDVYYLAGGAICIGLVTGVLFAFIQSISLKTVAILVDKRGGLEERTSTALEYAEERELPFHNPLLNDALKHTLSLSPRRYLPLRLPHEAKFLALGLVTLVVINFLPKYRFAEIREKKRTQVRMDTAAKEVKKATAKLEKTLRAEENLEMARLKEEMKVLAEALKRGQLTKKEALAKMAKLAERIKKLETEKKALATARSELAKAEELDEALKPLEQGKSEEFKSRVKALAKKVALEAGEGGLSQEQASSLDAALAGAQGAAGDNRALQDSIKKTRDALASRDSSRFETGLKDIASAMEARGQAAGLSSGLAGAGMSLKDAQRALAGLPVREAGAMAGSAGIKPGGLAEAGASGCCPHGVGIGGTCTACGGTACAGGGMGEGGTGYGSPGRGPIGALSGPGGGGEAGRGSTNIAREGGELVSERDKYPGRQSLDRAYQERQFVKIYAPEYTQVRPEDRFVPGKLGQGPIMGTVDIMGEPKDKEEAFVPYSQVLPTYRQAAEEALEKENIPLEYRQYIREYFDNL